MHHAEVVDIICRTIGIGVGLEAQRRYLTTRTPPHEISLKDVLGFKKKKFPYLEKDGPLPVTDSNLHCSSCHNVSYYIRQEAQKDWLLEKYDKNELIVIVSDEEDE